MWRTCRIAGVVLVTVAFSMPRGDAADAASAKVPEPIRQLLQDRKYAEAVAAIEGRRRTSRWIRIIWRT